MRRMNSVVRQRFTRGREKGIENLTGSLSSLSEGTSGHHLGKATRSQAFSLLVGKDDDDGSRGEEDVLCRPAD